MIKFSCFERHAGILVFNYSLCVFSVRAIGLGNAGTDIQRMRIDYSRVTKGKAPLESVSIVFIFVLQIPTLAALIIFETLLQCMKSWEEGIEMRFQRLTKQTL